MSENISSKNVRDDEIDLLELFRRMGETIKSWFKGLGRAFLVSIVFMLKRWLPLGLSAIAGVGVSYIIKTTSDSFYTSDMSLWSNAVPTSELISYINRLHTYSLEGNTEALADALKTDPVSIKNIIDISAFWVIDQNKDDIPDYVDYKNRHNVYDTVNIRMKNPMDIRVKVKSPQDLIPLQNGLLRYIESDSLFQLRNRLRLRQNQELLSRLDYDIQQLDSLQKVKYFEETRNMQPKTGGQMIFLQEQKTQLVYSDIYALYERKQTLETNRDIYAGIATITSEFSLPAKRDNGALYYGKFIIPVLFLITLLVSILLANRKKITEIFNKY